MSRQNPTANSVGQVPDEPLDDATESGAPEQDENAAINKDLNEEGDSGDFDEDETNPSPA